MNRECRLLAKNRHSGLTGNYWPIADESPSSLDYCARRRVNSRHGARFWATTRAQKRPYYSKLNLATSARPIDSSFLRRGRACAFRFVAKGNAPFRQIVSRHFDCDAVACKGLDTVLPHLPASIGKNLMATFQFYAIVTIRQRFGNVAVKFKQLFFRHQSDRFFFAVLFRGGFLGFLACSARSAASFSRRNARNFSVFFRVALRSFSASDKAAFLSISRKNFRSAAVPLSVKELPFNATWLRTFAPATFQIWKRFPFPFGGATFEVCLFAHVFARQAHLAHSSLQPERVPVWLVGRGSFDVSLKR